MPSIAENLARVEDAVAKACWEAGRPRTEVRLMAVSKTHPVDALLEAYAAGHRLFGENRVQEFAGKSAALPTDAGGDDALEVRLIGHLQSNKAAPAAELFHAIDTVDSFRLAARLHHAALAADRRLPVLLEIKLSEEPSKEGLLPDAPGLQQLLDQLPDWHDHLPCQGLMTIAPISPDPAVARACFRRLAALRNQLAQQHPRVHLHELSMGMSGDYAAAIAEGSTMVRIGTAIFGPRPRRAATRAPEEEEQPAP